MTANQRFAAWIVVAGALVVVCFFAGRALHPKPAAGYAFDQNAAAYNASLPAAGLSRGGFSGFDTTKTGYVLFSGRVMSVSTDTLTIQSSTGAQKTFQITADTRIARLEAIDEPLLNAGDYIVMRLNADGNVTDMLLGAAP